MIIDEIKKQNMLAMKEKDTVKRNALSVVINKYMLVNIEKKANNVNIAMLQNSRRTVILCRSLPSRTFHSEYTVGKSFNIALKLNRLTKYRIACCTQCKYSSFTKTQQKILNR